MAAVTYNNPDPTDVGGRRVGAWFIDLVIYLVIGFVISRIAHGGGLKTYRDLTATQATNFCHGWRATHSGICFSNQNGDQSTAYTIQQGLGSLWWPIHFVLYFVIQGVAGGSLGKLAVGLRVVTEDGQKAGVLRSFLRTLLWIADAVTCGLPILGGILMLTTKRHRRLGDMAASTYVVDKAQLGHPLQASAYVPYVPQAAAPWGATVPGGPPGAAGWSNPGGAVPAAPTTDQPTWDAQRNTYIQYDRAQSAWLQWDDSAKEWKPIS